DDGVEMLKNKKDRRIISFHDSLEYFAKEFGVEIVGVIEMPGQEPGSKEMSKLVDKCLKEDVRIIAVEPQYPEASATAIKNALKDKGKTAVLVEIDPLETAEPKDLSAGLYVAKMRENLKNLADNLP